MDLLEDDQLSEGGGGTQTQDLLLTSSHTQSVFQNQKENEGKSLHAC